MSNEPITIELTANQPLSGSGSIQLERPDFTISANGRFFKATIPSGSRIASGMFGLVADGEFVVVTVAASTNNPRDVARVIARNAVRKEVSLRATPQRLALAPGDDLAFVTHGSVVVVLIPQRTGSWKDGTGISRTGCRRFLQ